MLGEKQVKMSPVKITAGECDVIRGQAAKK